MSFLDVVVIAGLGSAVIGGYRLGFLARVASWIGLVLGLVLAVRLLPTMVDSINLPSPSGRLLIAAVVILAGAFVGQALGLVLGHRVRGVIPPGPLRLVDRAVGAVAGGMGVLLLLWLLLPSLADVPGWPARAARHSVTARFVDDVFPTPPNSVETLRRIVDERGFPRVFDALRPAPDVGAPPVDSGLSPEVRDRVAASTVKVMGEACRRIQEGSGFVVQEGVVVTNAHVVAGEDKVDVVKPDGRRLPATVAVFDPRRDLAVLRVANLRQPALEKASARSGDTGAVFGHPGGQRDVRAAPAKVSQRVTAQGQDIYNRERTRRDVYILAAALAPGDSGGPLVDRSGRVTGVAFAIAPDRPGTAYALTTAELDAVLARFIAQPAAKADTQACLA